jgi:hypothetical protein
MVYMQVRSAELMRQHEQHKARQLRLSRPLHPVSAPLPAPTQARTADPDNGTYWWEEIIRAVCDHYKVAASELVGLSRSRRVVIARQVVMYLSDQLTTNSLAVIGRALGRDDTTVWHGSRKIEAQIKSDPALAADVQALRLKLIGGEP